MRQVVQRLVIGAVGLLLVTGAARSRFITRTYDVRLAFVGYTGLAESADCLAIVDTLGYDSLVGTVTGVEDPSQPDEDVVYTGTLRRVTRIDYCETRPNPTPDQVAWCRARLTGAAAMKVELTVYGEDGNGAYLKATPLRAPDSASVAGTCLRIDMDSIRARYPSGESGGTPDGQPIAEPATLKLSLQNVRRLRPGYFPPARPETSWGLRVVRVTP